MSIVLSDANSAQAKARSKHPKGKKANIACRLNNTEKLKNN